MPGGQAGTAAYTWNGNVKASVTSTSGGLTLKSTFTGSLSFTVFPPTSPDTGIPPPPPPSSVHGSIEGNFEDSYNGEDESGDYGEGSDTGNAVLTISGTLELDGTIKVTIFLDQVNSTGVWTTKGQTFQTYTQYPTSLPVGPGESGPVLTQNTLAAVPQTGYLMGNALNFITIDLKSSKEQSMSTQTAIGMAAQAVTWMFTLVPPFTIQRDDRLPGSDGPNSFISTDNITFHVRIPGVPDINTSEWPSVTSWKVTGESPNSGDGNPNEQAGTSVFSFQPNPVNRPVAGSDQPNDPIKYNVAATVQGTTQNYPLSQDTPDIIRQEYVDFNSAFVPARAQFVTSPGPPFYNGPYSLALDFGMEAALNAITAQFNLLAQGAITVNGGYRNPQYNAFVHSRGVGSMHVRGRALDLAVIPANANTWQNLMQAGINAGDALSQCEDSPSHRCPCNNPGPPNFRVTHVHIDW